MALELLIMLVVMVSCVIFVCVVYKSPRKAVEDLALDRMKQSGDERDSYDLDHFGRRW